MKKTMTAGEAIDRYIKAIESGQDSKLTKPERQSGIYRFYKGIYLLGDGDWQRGSERLAKLEAERREQELKDNPAIRLLDEMQKSENPIHRMFVEFISQNGLELPLKDAKELQEKLLQKEIYESAKQLPAPVGAAKDGAKKMNEDLFQLMPKDQKTKDRFSRAWGIWNKMVKEYKKDVLDQASNEAKPKIQDFRARVVKEMNWQVSERRLQTVIQLGEAKLIK